MPLVGVYLPGYSDLNLLNRKGYKHKCYLHGIPLREEEIRQVLIEESGTEKQGLFTVFFVCQRCASEIAKTSDAMNFIKEKRRKLLEEEFLRGKK